MEFFLFCWTNILTFTISQENFSCNVNTFKMTLQSSGWGLNICYLVGNACCVRFEAIAFNHLWAYITHNAPLQRSYFTQMHFKHWQMLHLHPHGRSLPNHTLNAQINNEGESHTGMCKATTRFPQVLQHRDEAASYVLASVWSCYSKSMALLYMKRV